MAGLGHHSPRGKSFLGVATPFPIGHARRRVGGVGHAGRPGEQRDPVCSGWVEDVDGHVQPCLGRVGHGHSDGCCSFGGAHHCAGKKTGWVDGVGEVRLT